MLPIHHWALKIVPALVAVFRGLHAPGGQELAHGRDLHQGAPRPMEVSVPVPSTAMAKTVDFLLHGSHRDLAAARRFLRMRMIDRHRRTPEDHDRQERRRHCGHRPATTPEHEADIEMRQCKYRNNIVKQIRTTVSSRRVVRPMLGFKSMRCAKILLAGI